MHKPLISGIIPTYHRNDLLSKCLNSLLPGSQTLPSNYYEVIVTDDDIETTAEEMVSEYYPWVRWVAGPKKGPAANRNNGARYAKGDWLVFLDDDCYVDPYFLEAYKKAIDKKSNYLVFEGRTYSGRHRRSLAEIAPINETGGYLWACNFAIQNNLFKSLGGFDERFPYAAMEDEDLRLRIIKNGYKFLFIKEASVCHSWKIRNSWKKFKEHKESIFIYLSLHPEELSRINPKYYLKCALCSFIKDTISGMVRFKGRGFKGALLEYLSIFQLAYLLCIKNLTTKRLGLNNDDKK